MADFEVCPGTMKRASTFARRMAINQSFEEPTTSQTIDITRFSPDRLLTLLAAICALGFGTLSLVLYFMGESVPGVVIGYTVMGSVVFSFAIALVFGVSLLLAFSAMDKRPAEGAILGLAFSIVLLAFGALPGLIAGILGLVGALVGLVRNVKFVS